MYGSARSLRYPTPNREARSGSVRKATYSALPLCLMNCVISVLTAQLLCFVKYNEFFWRMSPSATHCEFYSLYYCDGMESF